MAEPIGTAIVLAIEALFYEGAMVFTAGQITAIGTATIAAASFGYSSHQKRRLQAQATAAYNRGLRDRKLTVRGTLEERDLVLGRVHKGGFFYPIGTTGDDQERLTFIVVMAGHSCSAINGVYFNEHLLTLDVDGWVTSAPYVTVRKRSATASISLTAGAGSVVLPHTPIAGSASVVFQPIGDDASVSGVPTISGTTVSITGLGTSTGSGVVQYQWEETYDKYARVRWVMGDEDQAAFADLIANFPDIWTSAHRLRGCCYAVVEILYSVDVFSSGIPNFSADMNGADTVYDPRFDRAAAIKDTTTAVAGTPGTPPTGWAVNASAGISRQIVGSGYEDGLPYLDVRFFGTASSTTYPSIAPAPRAAGAPGESWAGSGYIKLAGGTLTGVSTVAVAVAGYNSGGGFISGANSAAVTPTSASLSSQKVSRGAWTTPALTSTVGVYWYIAVNSGSTIDVTLRVAFPMLWKTTDVADVIGWSANPALLTRWYALHPMGGRRTSAQLDEATFLSAANVCDTVVDYGDGSTPLYLAGYVAKAGQVPAEVIDELTESMAGRWGYSQGRIRVRAGAVGATVASIDSDWLLNRQISIRPRRPRSDLRNVLQGTFPDGENAFQAVQFTRVVDAPSVADDGMELVGELEFSAMYRNAQCQQVAACMLRYERQALTITLNLKMRAYALQLFDVVALTLPDLGTPDGKLFEVIDRSFALGEGMQITLKEIDSSIFVFGTSFPITDAAPNTNLPSPFAVPTVGTLTATSTSTALQDGSVVARTRISWPAVADRGVTEGGYIELGFLDATQSAEYQVVRADQLTEHTLVGLRVGKHYIFKARAVNGSRVRGDWSATLVHQVTGRIGSTTYRQTTAPTGSLLRAGDIWYDSDDGNKPYRYSGSAWVSIQDASIAAALAAAEDAQATADGKIDTFWQTTAPGSASEGDIWFDTDDGYKQYRRTSGVWVLAADTRIGQAISDAADAQATADGKVVTFIQTTAPTAEGVGDLWLDSDAGNKLYRWSGAAWVAVALGTDALAAEAATEIQEFYDATGIAYSTYA